MQRIELKIKGDEAWPELDPKKTVEFDCSDMKVAFIEGRTGSGQPLILIRTDDEGIAFVMTITGQQFQGIYGALYAKYKDEPWFKSGDIEVYGVDKDGQTHHITK